MDVLVHPKFYAENREEAIKKLVDYVCEKGYVKDTCLKAILEREKVFPTGLVLVGKYHVAIPHGDVEHVLKPVCAVGVLNKPVEFRYMGDPKQKVDVSVVFLIGVAKKEEVVKTICKMAELFQKEGAVESIVNAKSDREAAKILKSELSTN
jgi:PTS system galactitol-specific IIA component